jgi:hypothetical protein
MYTFAFFGVIPFGNLFSGIVAEHRGIGTTLAVLGVGLLFAVTARRSRERSDHGAGVSRLKRFFTPMPTKNCFTSVKTGPECPFSNEATTANGVSTSGA